MEFLRIGVRYLIYRLLHIVAILWAKYVPTEFWLARNRNYRQYLRERRYPLWYLPMLWLAVGWLLAAYVVWWLFTSGMLTVWYWWLLGAGVFMWVLGIVPTFWIAYWVDLPRAWHGGLLAVCAVLMGLALGTLHTTLHLNNVQHTIRRVPTGIYRGWFQVVRVQGVGKHVRTEGHLTLLPDSFQLIGSPVTVNARIWLRDSLAYPGYKIYGVFAVERWRPEVAWWWLFQEIAFAEGRYFRVRLWQVDSVQTRSKKWQSIVVYAQRVALTMKARLLHLLPPQIAGVLLGITLGDRSAITPEIRSSFRRAGVAHLLAVSGLHVGFVVGLLYAVLGWLSGWARFAGIYVLAMGFLFLTGLPISGIRAFIMILLWDAGRQMGGRVPSLNSLGVATILILLWRPLAFLHVGFHLSFLAVLGILLFYPLLRGMFHVKPSGWWDLILVSLSAQSILSGYLLVRFGELSVYFLLGNLVAIPLAALLLYGTLLLLALSAILPQAWTATMADTLIWLCHQFLSLTSWISTLPGGYIEQIPSVPWLFLAWLAAWLLIWHGWLHLRFAILGIGSLTLLSTTLSIITGQFFRTPQPGIYTLACTQNHHLLLGIVLNPSSKTRPEVYWFSTAPGTCPPATQATTRAPTIVHDKNRSADQPWQWMARGWHLPPPQPETRTPLPCDTSFTVGKWQLSQVCTHPPQLNPSFTPILIFTRNLYIDQKKWRPLFQQTQGYVIVHYRLPWRYRMFLRTFAYKWNWQYIESAQWLKHIPPKP